MVISPQDYNSAVVCWRVGVDGVIEVLVLDSIPTHPDSADSIQVKFPGGGAYPGETPEQAARREFKEETGLRIRQKTKLTLFFSRKHGRHHKVGFLVERSGCRGTVSKHLLVESDSKVANRRFISIDQAERIVYRTPRNQTQLYLVLQAKATFKEMGLIP